MNITQAQRETLLDKAAKFNRPDLILDTTVVPDEEIPDGQYIGFWEGGMYFGIEKDGHCHT